MMPVPEAPSSDSGPLGNALVSVVGNQFAGDRRPKSLSQHIMFALPPDPSCRVLVGVRFAEQWRPIRAVKKDLERGFKKFSGNSPAVLWLHFSDVYMPDLKRDGDAILDDPLLLEVLERYLRPGKYPYPSGIIISASVPVIPDPGNPEILFMPICLRFYPNMGSSFNHRLFMATRP
jgi:hypothetical protein